MARLLQWIFSQDSRKYRYIFLAFIWLLGLYRGVCFYGTASISSFPLMHGINIYTVSIVSLLSVSLLPFLFSAIAVYIRSIFFLALLCFIKGCLFAYVSMGIYFAYGSAGWLIRLLMMFSNLCCLVPLWWCWLRVLSEDSPYHALLISSVAGLSIVGFDYCCVSPMLVRLLEI